MGGFFTEVTGRLGYEKDFRPLYAFGVFRLGYANARAHSPAIRSEISVPGSGTASVVVPASKSLVTSN